MTVTKQTFVKIANDVKNSCMYAVVLYVMVSLKCQMHVKVLG